MNGEVTTTRGSSRANSLSPYSAANLGWADMFGAMDAELKGLLDRQIADREVRIEQTMALDDRLAATAEILRSVPGIGPVASTRLIAGMPELGQLSGEQDAALTGLAPTAEELALLPEGSAVAEMLSDYAVMREQVRACM